MAEKVMIIKIPNSVFPLAGPGELSSLATAAAKGPCDKAV